MSLGVAFQMLDLRTFIAVADSQIEMNADSECQLKPNSCFAQMFCDRICRRSYGLRIRERQKPR